MNNLQPCFKQNPTDTNSKAEGPGIFSNKKTDNQDNIKFT